MEKKGSGLNRRGKLLRAFALAVVALGSVMAQAASRVDCGKIDSKILHKAVPYCAMLPPSYDEQKTRKYPVLYYLHGLGDNEQSLVNGGGWNLYEDMFASGKVGEFLIVTPRAERSFYVNSRDGKVRYEDFFWKEFLPEIERKYRIKSERDSRGIMGVSMGGYGAFHYAFEKPQMFVSVSAHMPALRETLPTNIANSREGRMLGDIFGDPVDRAYYKVESPFTLARKAPLASLKSLKIYFDCGANDDYGFNAGSEDLHEVLKSRGVKNEFHIYPGAHTWEYVIAHFGASLEWHSKAFGLK